MSEVTRILCAMKDGDRSAAEQLWRLVYSELRSIAASLLASEKSSHTLQATALVHEAYLRLVDVEKVGDWQSRGHFFGAAAEAMRRIVVDAARRRSAQKRGGGRARIELAEVDLSVSGQPIDLLDLDDALGELEETHPDNATVVKLRFFAGLSLLEIASALGQSRATVERRWAYARAWLFRRLTTPRSGP